MLRPKAHVPTINHFTSKLHEGTSLKLSQEAGGHSEMTLLYCFHLNVLFDCLNTKIKNLSVYCVTSSRDVPSCKTCVSAPFHSTARNHSQHHLAAGKLRYPAEKRVRFARGCIHRGALHVSFSSANLYKRRALEREIHRSVRNLQLASHFSAFVSGNCIRLERARVP